MEKYIRQYFSRSAGRWINVSDMHWKHLLNAFRREPNNSTLYAELAERMEAAFEPSKRPVRPSMGDSLRTIADALTDIADGME